MTACSSSRSASPDALDVGRVGVRALQEAAVAALHLLAAVAGGALEGGVHEDQRVVGQPRVADGEGQAGSDDRAVADLDLGTAGVELEEHQQRLVGRRRRRRGIGKPVTHSSTSLPSRTTTRARRGPARRRRRARPGSAPGSTAGPARRAPRSRRTSRRPRPGSARSCGPSARPARLACTTQPLASSSSRTAAGLSCSTRGRRWWRRTCPLPSTASPTARCTASVSSSDGRVTTRPRRRRASRARLPAERGLHPPDG